MTDVIKVMADKHMHKVRIEVTSEITQEFRGMVG